MVSTALFVCLLGACESRGNEENKNRNPNVLDLFHWEFLSLSNIENLLFTVGLALNLKLFRSEEIKQSKWMDKDDPKVSKSASLFNRKIE
jgi:hypothetical protein